MQITKLTWAGVSVCERDITILIDPIGSAKHITERPMFKSALMPKDFVPIDLASNVSAILITHAHQDHFDPDSIIKAFGHDVAVYLPLDSVHVATSAGLKNVIGVDVGDEYRVGDVFRVAATHSVDGFGTPQVAWIVKSHSETLAHFGDTIWHGFWWKIARKYGPIDVVCAPVNGPVLSVPFLPVQSSLHVSMTPEEAVEGAALLQAKHLLPIHYGTFHNPPDYTETSNILERVLRRAKETSINVLPLQPGESHVMGQLI